MTHEERVLEVFNLVKEEVQASDYTGFLEVVKRIIDSAAERLGVIYDLRMEVCQFDEFGIGGWIGCRVGSPTWDRDGTVVWSPVVGVPTEDRIEGEIATEFDTWESFQEAVGDWTSAPSTRSK